MPIRTPPLRSVHEEAGAKFTEFGGWDMPVEFDSIRTEHAAVRESVGRFDVSHMGELEVTGPDATRLVGRITTNDVTALDPGEAQYAGITTAAGHLIDDTVVYALPAGWAATAADADSEGEPAGEAYLLVPNAGNDQRVADWVREHRDERDLEATVANRTADYALFAVQGPDAADVLGDAGATATGDLARFAATVDTVAGVDCLVSRTGYTGEDGFEVLCPVDAAEPVWTALDCQPCGLGARDTLRIEMGYLLSGQDFHPEDDPRTPYEAGIGFVVKLDTEFVGRDALEAQDAEGVGERLVGLRLLDRGVPRDGHDVVDGEDHIVGTVTSGTMSPTLEEPVGMAYLPVEHAEPGTRMGVVIRGERKRAQVTTTPFLEGY